MNAKERWDAPKSEGGIPLSNDVPVIRARTTMDGILFTAARYKFVVRMLVPRKGATALELGCNNGFGTRYLRQRCDLRYLLGVDFDHDAIEIAQAEVADDICTFREEDFLGKDYHSERARGGLHLCIFYGRYRAHPAGRRADVR